jgi:hypothetical protein
MNSAHESDFCSDLSRSIKIQQPRICRRRGQLRRPELGPRIIEMGVKRVAWHGMGPFKHDPFTHGPNSHNYFAVSCRVAHGLHLRPKQKVTNRVIFVWKKSTFPPPTFAKVHFSSLNSKTGQTTSLNFSNRAFYLPGAVLKTVCYSKQCMVQ